MSVQGRRKRLETVENLVIEMLNFPQQTFKELLDRMTGERLKNRATCDLMSANDMPEELRGISRQSVYKALNFLEDAGILTGKPEQKLNRKTVKNTRIGIDVLEARKRYAQLWIEKFMGLEQCRNLPADGLAIVLTNLKGKFASMEFYDVREIKLLMDLSVRDIGPTESCSVVEYMQMQDIEAVMDYLWLFDDMRN